MMKDEKKLWACIVAILGILTVSLLFSNYVNKKSRMPIENMPLFCLNALPTLP